MIYRPISLKNLHVADAERGVDMLGDLLKEEFKVSFLILVYAHRTSHTLISLTSIRRQGLKQDTITMLEEKVAYQATNMNTDYWRKERKLGIGSKAWTHGKGYRVEVQWLFGVLYVAVESEQARKVKDKLEGYGYVLSKPLAVHGPH